jgi:hypothetical protein
MITTTPFANTPCLFTCTAARGELDSFVEEFTVDLSKIALITKRADHSYWLNLGATSIPMSKGIGDQVLPAWVAFQGKFDPAKDR